MEETPVATTPRTHGKYTEAMQPKAVQRLCDLSEADTI